MTLNLKVNLHQKKGQKHIMSKPVFIEYDSESKKAELINLFEEQTQKKLYPAQVENIILSILEYKASQLVAQFNEAALLNFPQYSRGLILDLIGKLFDCNRLKGAKGQATLKIELFEAFTFDFTIPKGLEILSKDEKYIFTTTEDLIITAGETSGTVTIESEDLTEDVNQYGVGDINILLNPVSYIKTVSNITTVTGGAGEETDDAYIERILLAPESFSTAGSKQSYIYHALASHPAIIDAQADAPQLPATITKGETIAVETNGTITGGDFSADIDYKTGTCDLTIGDNLYKIVIPPQNAVYIYPLTTETTTSDGVLSAVNKKFNEDDIIPMTDYVNVVAPTAIQKDITINVVIAENADYDKTSALINSAVAEYKIEMRKKLKQEIIPSQIISKIGNIDGVYAVDCGDLSKTSAKINEFFNLNITINITQRSL